MFPLLHTFGFFFLRGNHRTSSPSLCPTADGLTFIRDIVYQDRNISTQAISLLNEQAAQTTLYFRKLPLGSTGRTTMENLIYLRPFDVLFSLFFVAPALWRVHSVGVGHAARDPGLEGSSAVSSRVATSLLTLFPKHCHPSTGNKSIFVEQTVSRPPWSSSGVAIETSHYSCF